MFVHFQTLRAYYKLEYKHQQFDILIDNFKLMLQRFTIPNIAKFIGHGQPEWCTWATMKLYPLHEIEYMEFLEKNKCIHTNGKLENKLLYLY